MNTKNLTDEEGDELEPERKEKESEFTLLMVPQDILNNSGLVQMFSEFGPNTELSNLVTEESLDFFSIIKVDNNWLEQPVGSWEFSEDNITAKKFVHTVKTTNDVAKRAIKIATVYSQTLSFFLRFGSLRLSDCNDIYKKKNWICWTSPNLGLQIIKRQID